MRRVKFPVCFGLVFICISLSFLYWLITTMVTKEISNLTHEGGNTRVKNVNALGLAFLLSVFGVSALPQDNNRTATQTISASRDQTGQHPATASVAGLVGVKCLTAKSDVPNPQPEPGCHVDAPDVSADVKVGSKINFGRTGTMTLTCTGPGNLRCTAEVKRGQSR
jgi:hypothetical protein